MYRILSCLVLSCLVLFYSIPSHPKGVFLCCGIAIAICGIGIDIDVDIGDGVGIVGDVNEDIDAEMKTERLSRARDVAHNSNFQSLS